MTIITVWKHVGETPLDAMNRARREYGIGVEIRACYTNRLDPMAQGVMTLLFGEQVHRAAEYFTRSKVYRFQVILGVSTNSYDALGAITQTAAIGAEAAQAFRAAILEKNGKTMLQEFPPYSAYKYKGEPLWVHASRGTLPEVMPSHPITIHELKEISPPVQIALSKYKTECLPDIMSCPEAYTPEQFAEQWRRLRSPIELWRMVFEAHVSSGTYIRELVYDVSRSLSIPAHVFRITRTSVKH